MKTKIGLAVVCIAAAVGIWLSSGGEEPVPQTDEFKILWKCKSCEHEFNLSESEYLAAMAKANSQSPLYCPKCGLLEAYQPMKCSACGTLFYGPEVPGASGECPKCHPNARPPNEEPPVPGAKPVAKSR